MKAPQKIAEAIGAEGCYFLSLLHLAEGQMSGRIDPIEAYELAVSKAVMREDCFILDAGAILELFLVGEWDVRHERADYKTGPSELEILKFELGDKGHFVVGDGRGAVAWDPYGMSRTVKSGTLASKRIARRRG